MNLDTLKLYCAVVRLRSFSRAAAANGVTQSAASQSIQQLEGDLDVPLLDRGVLAGGAPSTVVSISDSCDVTLVREGAIPWSRARTIEEVLRG